MENIYLLEPNRYKFVLLLLYENMLRYYLIFRFHNREIIVIIFNMV